jgi:hypothetical protein
VLTPQTKFWLRKNSASSAIAFGGIVVVVAAAGLEVSDGCTPLPCSIYGTKAAVGSFCWSTGLMLTLDSGCTPLFHFRRFQIPRIHPCSLRGRNESQHQGFKWQYNFSATGLYCSSDISGSHLRLFMTTARISNN